MEKETKIRAVMIMDIVGRPPELLVESLENLIKEMEKEKEVTVKSKKISEPTPMKDNKDFYTTFAEVEIEVEDILYVAIMMFKYMPAHIEIVEPEIIALSNNGWSDIFSELVRRLHGFDEVARMMQLERDSLMKQLAKLTIKEIKPEKKASKKPKTKKTVKKKKK